MGATTNNTGDTSVPARIVITSDGQNVRVEMENCSGKDIFVMCGALQQVIGAANVKRGKGLDDTRDALLNIHLAAMEQLAEEVRKEGLT